MNRIIFCLTLAFLLAGCAKPKALIEADLDPTFKLQSQGVKIFVALKDETVEEKKFSFFLEEELKNLGYTLTASPELSDFHLLYALSLENYKTKEFIMLSNPEFVSGTLDGRNFTAQRNAYRYEPVERAHIMKQIHLDLYQRNKGKLEKVWSGMMKLDNDDYRNHTKACVKELANAIGKDMNQKVFLK
ncbi:MAG: hypothetical protein IT286_03895 [Proteobacteria bacterium]|jgi:hypothetical protein|nr:hypothetical protein [Pseudomonadota bacterium]